MMLFLPFFFLALSLVFLWIPWLHNAWFVPFTFAVVFALISNVLTLFGVGLLLLLLFFCYSSRHPEKFHLPKGFSDFCIVIFVALLFYHLLPGFQNWEVVSSYQMSPTCPPFSFALRFDKGAPGLLLLAFMAFPLCKNRRDWRLAFHAGIKTSAIAFILLLLSALALGYVHWDMKAPSFWKVWVFYNLFFVAIPEEVFFRGFLQNKLTILFQRHRSGAIYALVLSSIIFGLAHFSGGPTYVFLSFIAGLLYGIAYLWKGYLESAIFTHFMVNALHFFLFSYPCLINME
ncbi:MAG TPA: CPBP family intramembrane glutamic endopeptidase [Chlamydiales bacterium]|nr:CPBP family intramembrane glutamic endopeptidase [Chlamydiales bacterium]